MKDKKLLMKDFFHENILMRKAMFLPMAFILTFMLVGYAAIDKEPPTIVTDVIDLPYGEEFDVNTLDIKDNQSKFEDLNIMVDTLSLNINQLGNYTVSVVARDEFENETSKNIRVNIVDLTAPEFSVVGSNGGYVVQVPVKGSSDVTSYVKAFDNVDGDVTPFIESDVELKTDKLGFQFITLSVEDTTGNIASKQFKFSISDNEAPIIRLLKGSSVTWNYGTTFDLDSVVSIVDNMDDNVNVSIDGSVNVKKMNVEQKITITATDQTGNSTSQSIKVTVKDLEAPVIKLTKTSISVDIGDSVKVSSYLSSATDNKDGDLTSKVTYGTVSTSSAGSRTVTYTVTDEAGNKGTATLTVNVINPYASVSGQTALAYAKTKLGSPYVYGATGPYSFDCSGLMYWCFRQAGVTLPRTSSSQASVGSYVARSDLLPGDLVFFTSGYGIDHVGIYAGNGMMIHAPYPGKTVSYISISQMTYVTARRV